MSEEGEIIEFELTLPTTPALEKLIVNESVTSNSCEDLSKIRSNRDAHCALVNSPKIVQPLNIFGSNTKLLESNFKPDEMPTDPDGCKSISGDYWDNAVTSPFRRCSYQKEIRYESVADDLSDSPNFEDSYTSDRDYRMKRGSNNYFGQQSNRRDGNYHRNMGKEGRYDCGFGRNDRFESRSRETSSTCSEYSNGKKNYGRERNFTSHNVRKNGNNYWKSDRNYNRDSTSSGFELECPKEFRQSPTDKNTTLENDNNYWTEPVSSETFSILQQPCLSTEENWDEDDNNQPTAAVVNYERSSSPFSLSFKKANKKSKLDEEDFDSKNIEVENSSKLTNKFFEADNNERKAGYVKRVTDYGPQHNQQESDDDMGVAQNLKKLSTFQNTDGQHYHGNSNKRFYNHTEESKVLAEKLPSTQREEKVPDFDDIITRKFDRNFKIPKKVESSPDTSKTNKAKNVVYPDHSPDNWNQSKPANDRTPSKQSYGNRNKKYIQKHGNKNNNNLDLRYQLNQKKRKLPTHETVKQDCVEGYNHDNDVTDSNNSTSLPSDEENNIAAKKDQSWADDCNNRENFTQLNNCRYVGNKSTAAKSDEKASDGIMKSIHKDTGYSDKNSGNYFPNTSTNFSTDCMKDGSSAACYYPLNKSDPRHSNAYCRVEKMKSPEYPNPFSLCPAFVQGSCPNGTRCLQMHSDFPCPKYYLGLECDSSDPCKFSHNGPLKTEHKTALLNYLISCPNSFVHSRKQCIEMITKRDVELKSHVKPVRAKTIHDLDMLFYLKGDVLTCKKPYERIEKDGFEYVNIKNLFSFLNKEQVAKMSLMGINNIEDVKNMSLSQMEELQLSIWQILQFQRNTMMLLKLALNSALLMKVLQETNIFSEAAADKIDKTDDDEKDDYSDDSNLAFDNDDAWEKLLIDESAEKQGVASVKSQACQKAKSGEQISKQDTASVSKAKVLQKRTSDITGAQILKTKPLIQLDSADEVAFALPTEEELLNFENLLNSNMEMETPFATSNECLNEQLETTVNQTDDLRISDVCGPYILREIVIPKTNYDGIRSQCNENTVDPRVKRINKSRKRNAKLLGNSSNKQKNTGSNSEQCPSPPVDPRRNRHQKVSANAKMTFNEQLIPVLQDAEEVGQAVDKMEKLVEKKDASLKERS